jgi:hypothetical protein
MENKKQFTLAVVLIVLATLTRLIPHVWNFTPVVAILLFSAFIFRGYLKIIIPFSAILISDIFLEITEGTGFHQGTWLIYLSFGFILTMGHIILRKASFLRILASSLVSSILFYLITNFALFYPEVTEAGQLQGYPHTWEGIIGSYTAGIPFFRNMLAGDLFFTALLFGTYHLVNRQIFRTQLSK